MPATDNLELTRQAERIELAAFVDMYQTAPPAAGARVERIADATLLIAPGLPLGLFNRAIGLGLSQPVSRDDISAIVDRFETAGSPKYFIHARPASDPALVPLLEREGFALTTDLQARPIGPDEAPRFAEVVSAAFRMPPFMNQWVQSLTSRSGWTAFAAFDGAAMVAGGMRWQRAEGAWLGMAGTLPEARGRGAQGAILRARSDGAAGLVTTETWLPPAGGHNTSLANMHRAGFVTIAERANYQRI
jgi:hypothetical protein